MISLRWLIITEDYKEVIIPHVHGILTKIGILSTVSLSHISEC